MIEPKARRVLKLTTRTTTVYPFICLCFLIGTLGCASYRGMPTHGGGKRFDEEQRIVSASIRHAAQQMNLCALKGKRISLVVSNLETSGTGQPFYPGLGEVTISPLHSDVNDFIRRTNQPIGGGFETQTYNSNDGNTKFDVDSDIDFQFNPSLKANNITTRQDIEYLTQALHMRLHHEGIQVVDAEVSEVMLIVLVDVLGTNLSRLDFAVAYEDDLGASCELTYYAINSRNQLLISPSKFVGSEANYKETNYRFTPFRKEESGVGKLDSSIVPLEFSHEPIPGYLPDVPVVESGPSNGKGGGGGGGGSKKDDARLKGKTMKQQLDILYQEALSELEAENIIDAKKTINAIRKLDKEFIFLPDLERQLEEF